MSGNVTFSTCHFTHNDRYGGHGAAIYYMSENHIQFELVINNCNFSFSSAAKSIVFFARTNKSLRALLSLQNSIFLGNKGVPIYISNNNLHIIGIVHFKHNVADQGGGIFSTNSVVNFDHQSIRTTQLN